MLKSKFVWCEADHTKYESIGSQLHSEVERLFLARGLGGAEELLGDQAADLVWHEPFSFIEMQVAIDRIKQAIAENELILVYGDYDADGTTSTAILIRTLRFLGAAAHFYIPHRFFEGYGPNEDAFLQAVGEGYKLIITVDCGITGVAEAEVLKAHGVDLIIIDHHQPKAEIPQAVAIIHPEYDEHYPFNELAGAGVTLKVAEALREGKLEADDYMLAMFGTVGDVVTLVDENRSIVKRGLSACQKTTLPGVLALLRMADVNPYEVDEMTVGFSICPRLNAPGRMDDARLVIDLLLAEDAEVAMAYAQEIEVMNSQRKMLTNQITEAAIQLAESKDLTALKALVLYHPDWHEGVLGIVASKLVEKYGKAIVILTDSEEGAVKGSARAPEGFDILKALVANEDLLGPYGGHERAAGLSLKMKDPGVLEAGLNRVLNSCTATQKLQVDLQMGLAEIDFKWLADVDYLAPFGQGNKRPLVRLSGMMVKDVKRMGATHEHLKFTMHAGGYSIDTIFFGGAPTFIYLTPESKFDVLCEVEINEWNGNKKLQARVKDIKCDDIQLLDLRNQKLETEFVDVVDDGFVVDRVFDSKAQLKAAYLASGAKNIVLKRLGTLTMPDRKHFVFVYRIVKEQAPFHLTPDIMAYFEQYGVPQAMLVFIVRVFTEVGLLGYDEGVVRLNEGRAKVDFKTAPSYRSREAKVALHEFLELHGASEILKFMVGEGE